MTLFGRKRRLFERSMLAHASAAYSLARYLLGDPDDAEDAVQSAYLKAFRAFDGFEPGNGRGWSTATGSTASTCSSGPKTKALKRRRFLPAIAATTSSAGARTACICSPSRT